MLFRLSTHMISNFGEPDQSPNNMNSIDNKNESKIEIETSSDQNEKGNEDINPFPENEIDEMRSLRDAAIARYRQVSKNEICCTYYSFFNNFFLFRILKEKKK